MALSTSGELTWYLADDRGDVKRVGTGGNILEGDEVAVSVGQRRRDLAPEPEFLEPRGKQAHGPFRQR